jgi:hypothetical protein
MNLELILRNIYTYINELVNHNETASALLITGLTATVVAILIGLTKLLKEFILRNYTTTLIVDSSDSIFDVISVELATSEESLRVFNVKGYKAKSGQDKPFTKTIGVGLHLVVYESTPMLIQVTQIDKAGNWQVLYNMKISKLGKSHSVFNKLLTKASSETEVGYVKVYQQERGTDRKYITTQPHRYLNSVFLPKDIEDKLISAIDTFKSSEEWYIKNNIPYQLGILIHGVPGSGKTTLSRAIASLFPERDIVLTSSTNEFKDACLASNGIIIAEEIDTMMIAKRDLDDEDDSSQTKVNTLYNSLGVSILGNVLSSLDGVVHNHGRIFVATTNNIDALDSAMLRPGRIDLVLELNEMDTHQYQKMIKHFFDVYVDVSDKTMKCKTTPVYVQQDIIKLLNDEDAVNKLNEMYLV